MYPTLPGFEPGIFWSVVRRVIRCATGPTFTNPLKCCYSIAIWNGRCLFTSLPYLKFTLFCVRFKVQYNFHLMWRITEPYCLPCNFAVSLTFGLSSVTTVPIYWETTPRYSITGPRRFKTSCLIYHGRNVQDMKHFFKRRKPVTKWRGVTFRTNRSSWTAVKN